MVIFQFVDIGGINGLHCLNFPLIIWDMYLVIHRFTYSNFRNENPNMSVMNRMTRCRGLTRHTTLRRCNAILFMDRRLQYLSLICLITNTKNVFAFLFCV